MQSELRDKTKSSEKTFAGPESRILGHYGGESGGPMVICIGGLHGNEPAGVNALGLVFDMLSRLSPAFRGEFVGVAGNLRALGRGVRYLDVDLNRIWEPRIVDELLAAGNGGRASNVEESERGELIEIFAEYCKKAVTGVYFLDLHTTSSEGRPFITIADTLRNRAFTDAFPVPRVLGIEEQLDSTLLNYINELGFISVGFEAGRHNAESSVERCVAAIFITLVQAGCLSSRDISGYKGLVTDLKRAAMSDNSIYEVRYRHNVEDSSAFSMNPGYINFQDIRSGEILARNSDNDVKSPEDGKIFMPLYQKQGNDGFFVIRRISAIRLYLSLLLRKLGVDKVLPYLPGIARQGGTNRILAVNPGIARWYLIELLHMLGYRRKSREGGLLIATKRKYDMKAPSRFDFGATSEKPDSL